MTVLPSAALPAPAAEPALAPVVHDPLPLPQPGWGVDQAREAVAEAALALPSLAGPGELVRALSTVVLRVGDQAVKVHPPGTDPAHLAQVHAALATTRVAVTALAAPVVTSNGVVTVTPWLTARRAASWGEVGAALRALHELPAAAELPAWTPLRRLPAQLDALPAASAGLLRAARAALLERLADLEPVLPAGALHGDVSPDNVLLTRRGPRWIDLDFACAGMPEYDLSAVVRRFEAGQVSAAEYEQFVSSYGTDLRGWSGLAVMDALCRLSGVGFRLWLDRCAGRPSAWLAGELSALAPAAR